MPMCPSEAMFEPRSGEFRRERVQGIGKCYEPTGVRAFGGMSGGRAIYLLKNNIFHNCSLQSATWPFFKSYNSSFQKKCTESDSSCGKNCTEFDTLCDKNYTEFDTPKKTNSGQIPSQTPIFRCFCQVLPDFRARF